MDVGVHLRTMLGLKTIDDVMVSRTGYVVPFWIDGLLAAGCFHDSVSAQPPECTVHVKFTILQTQLKSSAVVETIKT